MYDGSLPLAAFLKNYFAEHKKFGSRDRKQIAHLCYCYFRLGKALPDITFEERLLVALFLCESRPQGWEILYGDDWVANWNELLSERILFVQSVYNSFTAAALFPFLDELSTGINADAFCFSHLVQPDLFLRIRPGYEQQVKQKLKEADIPFEKKDGHCIALPNATKIDDILLLDREAVVQDLNSQKIAGLLDGLQQKAVRVKKVWDCCAASGGKSILAYDCLPGIELTATDIRPAIIRNLEKRFERAGITKYHSVIVDIAKESGNTLPQFDLVICDAPCTGSGTWGRTPEQLYFFSKEELEVYTARQKKIVDNISGNIIKGGYLLYITCSVFRKENEDLAKYLQDEKGLVLVKMELLSGYESKADTLFAALFRSL